ncbi:MAG: redoxin domain-containing protein [Gemmataceae bacterium]|nr:redoxin domain-containing protein [Gemmataceae bacterium]
MRILRRMGWLGLVGLLFLPPAAQTARTQDRKAEPIELRVVKYSGLAEEIHKHLGKVIVVDFWGDFCIPCKQAFPHLVEMQRTYGKDGLVAISVSVDPLKSEERTEEEVKAAVLKFLRAKGATFTNLLLDEPTKVWQNKLRIEAVPAVFVFSRQGKWVQFKGDDGTLKKEPSDKLAADGKNYYRYPEVEALVQKLLKEK